VSDVQPIPAGFHTITPHLCVEGAAQAIEFYKAAFTAEEVCRSPTPDGRLMHAELRIGDSMIFVNDDFPEFSGKASSAKALGGSPVTIHICTADCDGDIQRAVDAGATLTMPPTDMFWGDRYGKVTCPFGHHWSFSTRVRDVSPEEMQAAGEAMFKDPGACD
jgi:PhnB protein